MWALFGAVTKSGLYMKFDLVKRCHVGYAYAVNFTWLIRETWRKQEITFQKSVSDISFTLCVGSWIPLKNRLHLSARFPVYLGCFWFHQKDLNLTDRCIQIQAQLVWNRFVTRVQFHTLRWALVGFHFKYTRCKLVGFHLNNRCTRGDYGFHLIYLGVYLVNPLFHLVYFGLRKRNMAFHLLSLRLWVIYCGSIWGWFRIHIYLGLRWIGY